MEFTVLALYETHSWQSANAEALKYQQTASLSTVNSEAYGKNTD